ncbi:zinc finger protein 524-like [Thrips palmi]|uniref:Zinc finger protein 524-like n=1 Tax=Thrips palmi TaxID=161013 RepID=A0A6P8ZX58_THRPL|nr:zinc finger protein 524-like [Thrips palmi]
MLQLNVFRVSATIRLAPLSLLVAASYWVPYTPHTDRADQGGDHGADADQGVPYAANAAMPAMATGTAPGSLAAFHGPLRLRGMRGAGSFPCQQCGKTYRWKGNLSQHLRYECGMPPQFKCPYCPYRSKHRSDLKNKHMKTKHPNLPLILPTVAPATSSFC